MTLNVFTHCSCKLSFEIFHLFTLQLMSNEIIHMNLKPTDYNLNLVSPEFQIKKSQFHIESLVKIIDSVKII